MTVEYLIIIIGGLLTLLSTTFWFSLNRILKRIDDLMKKFEAFPETISRIYKDIHAYDQEIRELIHEIEMRLIKLEARCDFRHSEDDKP